MRRRSIRYVQRSRPARRPGRATPFIGFMPLTLLASALVVPLIGWMSGRLANEHLMAEARAAEVDRRTVSGLEALGWRTVASAANRGAASRAGDDPGIAWMRATSRFGLELGHGRVECGPPPPRELGAAMEALQTELERYPHGALRQARFKRILACGGLREAGVPIPSLPNVEQSLLLDVDAPATYLIRLLHHEVFHFIDFAEDSQLKSDPAWEALNAPNFTYGAGGRSMRQAGSARLTHDLAGFVTLYATSAVEEDKAELFACIMAYPRELAELQRHDPIVARKVELLQAQVQGCIPTMGRGFWTAVLRESWSGNQLDWRDRPATRPAIPATGPQTDRATRFRVLERRVTAR